MAITSASQLIGAAKQAINYVRTGARTTVAAGWFTVFDGAGSPGSGTLAGANTTTGVVPDDTVAGFPTISAFGGGNIGYLAQVDFGNSVACRIRIYDLLWKAGAYAFNASTTGQTPTSYAARIPNADYTDCEIWLEQVTAGTGVQSVAVTYTNELGVAGRATGTIVTGTNTVGRMFRLPLQAGDKGVQGITGVVGSVATVGTFNILVMRPLWSGRVRVNNDGDIHGPDKTMMKQIFDTSAIYPIIAADSTTSGVYEIEMTIANG